MQRFLSECARAAMCANSRLSAVRAWVLRSLNHSPRGITESPDAAPVINHILELNPTASPLFLAQFSASALANYLDHLVAAAMPRGRSSHRVRAAHTPGILARSARA